MRTFIGVMASCLLCVGLFAQTQNRFPAPLGLDRMLSGTIRKAPAKGRPNSSDGSKAAKYILSADGETYQLHGHEKELKRLVGKKVRMTGTAVGEEFTVHSVAAAKE